MDCRPRDQTVQHGGESHRADLVHHNRGVHLRPSAGHARLPPAGGPLDLPGRGAAPGRGDLPDGQDQLLHHQGDGCAKFDEGAALGRRLRRHGHVADGGHAQERGVVRQRGFPHDGGVPPTAARFTSQGHGGVRQDGDEADAMGEGAAVLDDVRLRVRLRRAADRNAAHLEQLPHRVRHHEPHDVRLRGRFGDFDDRLAPWSRWSQASVGPLADLAVLASRRVVWRQPVHGFHGVRQPRPRVDRDSPGLHLHADRGHRQTAGAGQVHHVASMGGADHHYSRFHDLRRDAGRQPQGQRGRAGRHVELGPHVRGDVGNLGGLGLPGHGEDVGRREEALLHPEGRLGHGERLHERGHVLRAGLALREAHGRLLGGPAARALRRYELLGPRGVEQHVRVAGLFLPLRPWRLRQLGQLSGVVHVGHHHGAGVDEGRGHEEDVHPRSGDR
mmetsp:Transcript_95457/g.291967  ORF Transcript_95457/g.291967 Transcript_95457/m.291967 type:complete len:444 (+) Transcript_95457:1229-2560(+)